MKPTQETLNNFGGYGRFSVTCLKTNKTIYSEPITKSINHSGNWGDQINGKITGDYNGKSRGAIVESESLITEANGFHKIEVIEGGSPFSAIEKRLEAYRSQM